MNYLGLPEIETQRITDQLNTLLASYQIHYQNLRGLHWNIKGARFFELHVKFEEYYNDAQEKIDLVAERILTLGYSPQHTFEDYLKGSEIVSSRSISNSEEAVTLIESSLTILLGLERPILQIAGDINDDGTADLMTQFIAQQEKELWMLRSWLKRD